MLVIRALIYSLILSSRIRVLSKHVVEVSRQLNPSSLPTRNCVNSLYSTIQSLINLQFRSFPCFVLFWYWKNKTNILKQNVFLRIFCKRCISKSFLHRLGPNGTKQTQFQVAVTVISCIP